MATLKMTGGPTLERALRELGGQIAGRLGQNSVNAGARVIAAGAKRRAPKRTGRYAKTIRTFTDPAERRSGGSTRSAYAGTRDPLGHLLEFGTVHMAARAHFRPALDEDAQEAVDKLADNLGKGITRETAKYRGK